VSGFSGVALRKTFARGSEPVHALDGVDLRVEAGELVALVGPSGSGKSTLLALLCGWESADSGTLAYAGALADRPPSTLGWPELALVPQALGLVPDLSLADNVLLPARLRGGLADTRERAGQLLADFGLAHLADRYPHQASLGEQQRVAVARALAARPEIIFGDEPTGNLDSRAGAEVLGFLRRSVDELGQTIVMVTHDPVAASYADRVLYLADGRIVDEMHQPTADQVLDRMKDFDSRGRTS
jgi:putative ABC transport system ATP-binding protein